ncbi:flavoprotein [Dictyobacter halimunensis]|uniref:flavoprotein n=1 Tax=Dictyobacter halimunensis TaxID=3026934 RepID=UPI0030C6B82A
MRTLALVVCAALSAGQVQDLVGLAQEDGWDVWVIATPNACSFIDQPLLTALTGHPVVVSATEISLPHFTAAVVVPATFNTLRKWSQGVADTYALTLLLDWTRRGAPPILAFPRASAELAQDSEFAPSLDRLRWQGVTVYYRPDLYPPNNNLPWSRILEILQALPNANNGQPS